MNGLKKLKLLAPLYEAATEEAAIAAATLAAVDGSVPTVLFVLWRTEFVL